MPTSKYRPFRKDEVVDYERRRYRGLDQRLVHSREMGLLGRVFQEIAPQGGLRLLDAPCGYGRFSEFLVTKASFLVSSDYSAAMVERAVGRGEGGVAPRGVVSDLKLGLPFGPATFDAAVSMRFFHHLHLPEERAALLEEFSRVSRLWAVVSFYRLNVLHRFQRWVRHGIKHGRTRIKMITREEFEAEARGAGWDVIRIYPLLRGMHAQNIVLLRKSAI